MVSYVNHPWTTANELEFIDGLGAREASALPRLQALQHYAIAISKRVRWDRLDRTRIIDYLMQSLREVEEASP